MSDIKPILDPGEPHSHIPQQLENSIKSLKLLQWSYINSGQQKLALKIEVMIRDLDEIVIPW